MHRNAHPTAPAGHYTDGDPSRGIAPTVVPAATMEALQEEICNVIEYQKIKLDPADNGQLLQAILKLVSYQITTGNFVTYDDFNSHTHSQYELKTNLKQAAYRDVGTVAGTVAAGDHAHSQYELKTNLKQGAYRDVGTVAGTVAAGDHSHSQYELKTNLKQGAYRDVGTGSNQLAAGDHSHSGLLSRKVLWSGAAASASFEMQGADFAFITLNHFGRGEIQIPVDLPEAIRLGRIRWYNRGGENADRDNDIVLSVIAAGTLITISGGNISMSRVIGY